MSQPMHLTLSGVAAGAVLCGRNKAAGRAAGETFIHVEYANLDADNVCTECYFIWSDTSDDDEPELACRDCATTDLVLIAERENRLCIVCQDARQRAAGKVYNPFYSE